MQQKSKSKSSRRSSVSGKANIKPRFAKQRRQSLQKAVNASTTNIDAGVSGIVSTIKVIHTHRIADTISKLSENDFINLECPICELETLKCIYPRYSYATSEPYGCRVWCIICARYDEIIFHCPSEYPKRHPIGFDYCFDCGLRHYDLFDSQTFDLKSAIRNNNTLVSKFLKNLFNVTKILRTLSSENDEYSSTKGKKYAESRMTYEKHNLQNVLTNVIQEFEILKQGQTTTTGNPNNVQDEQQHNDDQSKNNTNNDENGKNEQDKTAATFSTDDDSDDSSAAAKIVHLMEKSFTTIGVSGLINNHDRSSNDKVDKKETKETEAEAEIGGEEDGEREASGMAGGTQIRQVNWDEIYTSVIKKVRIDQESDSSLIIKSIRLYNDTFGVIANGNDLQIACSLTAAANNMQTNGGGDELVLLSNIEYMTEEETGKVRMLKEKGFLDERLNYLKLGLYDSDIAKTVKYYEKDEFCIDFTIGRYGLHSQHNQKFKIKGCGKRIGCGFEHKDSLLDIQNKTHRNKPKSFYGVKLCEYLAYLKSKENEKLLRKHFNKRKEKESTEKNSIENPQNKEKEKDKDKEKEKQTEFAEFSEFCQNTENLKLILGSNEMKTQSLLYAYYGMFIKQVSTCMVDHLFSEKCFKQSIKLSEINDFALIWYSQLLDERLKNYDKCKSNFENALNIAEHSPAWNRQYADFLFNRKEYKQASEYYDRTYELSGSKDNSALYMGAMSLYRNKDYKEAYSKFKETLKKEEELRISENPKDKPRLRKNIAVYCKDFYHNCWINEFCILEYRNHIPIPDTAMPATPSSLTEDKSSGKITFYNYNDVSNSSIMNDADVDMSMLSGIYINSIAGKVSNLSVSYLDDHDKEEEDEDDHDDHDDVDGQDIKDEKDGQDTKDTNDTGKGNQNKNKQETENENENENGANGDGKLKDKKKRVKYYYDYFNVIEHGMNMQEYEDILKLVMGYLRTMYFGSAGVNGTGYDPTPFANIIISIIGTHAQDLFYKQFDLSLSTNYRLSKHSYVTNSYSNNNNSNSNNNNDTGKNGMYLLIFDSEITEASQNHNNLKQFISCQVSNIVNGNGSGNNTGSINTTQKENSMRSFEFGIIGFPSNFNAFIFSMAQWLANEYRLPSRQDVDFVVSNNIDEEKSNDKEMNTNTNTNINCINVNLAKLAHSAVCKDICVYYVHCEKDNYYICKNNGDELNPVKMEPYMKDLNGGDLNQIDICVEHRRPKTAKEKEKEKEREKEDDNNGGDGGDDKDKEKTKKEEKDESGFYFSVNCNDKRVEDVGDVKLVPECIAKIKHTIEMVPIHYYPFIATNNSNYQFRVFPQ